MDPASFFFSLLILCASGDAVCDETDKHVTVCSEYIASHEVIPVGEYRIELVPGCRGV